MFSQNQKNGFFKATCLGVALLVAAPAFSGVTRVSELVDVDPNVWAYKAVKELVEKYEIFEGYPDKTFKGNRSVTRYELAQTLYEVLKVMDVMDSGSITGADLEKIGRLKRQFDRELSDVRNKVASLEGRVSALEADSGSDYMMVGSSWTDRIKVSGDITNQLRNDFTSGSGASRDATSWGTRARLGVDAVIIGQNDNDFLGEGIAHIRINAGNGGPGTYNYATSGNNLDDILFDSSNPGITSNNSLFAGRGGDSRMDAYLEQAYYTQILKFQDTDPCSNEVTKMDSFFAQVDLGQQDLWNTFHKSLVREDSLDGFVNQRILHGAVGGSDSTTEALHIGLNWLGGGTEGERVDACGNPISEGIDSCGNPLPGFFQAFSLDYAIAAHKDINPIGGSFTTNRAWDNITHSLAGNLLYDLPGSAFSTGLFTVGASASHLDWNGFNGVNTAVGNVEDDWGWTFFTKWEQYFGENRTFGMFADYTWASHDSSNTYLQGPVNHLVQLGGVINTNFLSDTWNFNKDQVGMAYSFMVPHEGAVDNGNPGVISAVPTSAVTGPSVYTNSRKAEHIAELYYRKYITENISVTPDLVVNFSANGHTETSYSLGLRTTIKLPNWNDGGAFDQFGYRDWSQRVAKYKAAHSL